MPGSLGRFNVKVCFDLFIHPKCQRHNAHKLHLKCTGNKLCFRCMFGIIRTRNITYISCTKTTTNTAEGRGRKMTAIEKDFLAEVRTANPDDCKRIVNIIQSAMRRQDGFKDENGDFTDLGLLAGAITEELTVNGILKQAGRQVADI